MNDLELELKMSQQRQFRLSTAANRAKAKESFLKICSGLGLKPQTITDQCRTPPIVKLRRSVAEQLLMEGYTPSEIATAIHRDRCAVKHMLGLRKCQNLK